MDKKTKKWLKKQRYNLIFYTIIAIIIIAVISAIIATSSNNDGNHQEDVSEPTTIQVVEPTTLYNEDDSFETKLNAFASAHSLDRSSWTEKLLEKGEENPELHEFVLNYPLKKDQAINDDLSNLANSQSVPLLIQWDERWAYSSYNNSIMGLSGCGPTCMSMISIYLLNDTSLTPIYMAGFSEDNNYCYENSGTNWNLMSKGGPKLGLKVQEIPNVKKTIIDNLNAGHPIICNVGPGNFTKIGHYIVLAGVEDGKIIINDPNSPINSAKRWDYDEFSDQIKNMWAFSK